MIRHKKISKPFYILSLSITLIVYILSTNLGFSDLIDKKIYDIFTHFHFKNKIKMQNTVVVKIDTKSLNELGQWPWSRLVMTKLIQTIQQTRPASIGVDIIFAEEDRTSPKILQNFYKQNLGIDADFSSIPKNLQDNDIILSHTLSKPNIATSIIVTDFKNEQSCNPKNYILSKGDFSNFINTNAFICNTKNIQKYIKNSGFINAHLSNDGRLRNYSLAYRYGDKIIPSLGVAMIKSVDKNILLTQQYNLMHPYFLEFLDHKIYTNAKSEVYNYIHSPQKFKNISAIDVLKKDFNSSLFTGKFVIIGTTAIGLSDFYTSQDGTRVNGLFSHASFIENALHNTLLYAPDFIRYLMYLLSFSFAIFLIYLTLLNHYTIASITGFFISAIASLLTYIFIYYKLYLPLGFFLTPLFVSYFFILSLVSYISQKKEHELNQQIVQIRSSIINNMMTMIETRDSETGNHTIRTKEYAKILTQQLYDSSSYSEDLSPQTINNIYQATPLHDIGKIGIPDYILQKPNRLTDEEKEIMKTHTTIGYKIISSSPKMDLESSFFKVASNIIYTHHEKWDGTGYPRGLKGKDIPFEGRIVSICDVYDALTSKRYYKPPFDFNKAKDIINKGKGSHFDPIIVDAFLQIEHKFQEIAIAYKDN